MMKVSRTNIFEILGRNPVHPFPARMAPGIAMQAMSYMRGPLKVLDPMMGSGTVLALARSNGHKAFGFDIDPLAVMISKAWTESCNRTEARSLAAVVLEFAQTICDEVADADAYPPHADTETRQFIDYWFDSDARKELTALAGAISSVENEVARGVLWCALSRLIITKQFGVSLAMDLSHSRPHRVFERAPVRPFDKFIASVEKVLQGVLDEKTPKRGPAPSLTIGDARRLPLKNESIDLVITSPPYLNAIDYIRCSKFSLVWMGYSIEELRKLRSGSVGTEVGANAPVDDHEIEEIITALRVRTTLNPKNRGILGQYIHDMRGSIRETSRVLRTGGTVVYVVGENTVRDTYIRTAVIVRHLAQNAGLMYVGRRTRALPANRRYLPPPSLKNGAMDTRMRQEVILTFSK
jgi:SAM-dependent methyltransferase